MRLPTTGGALRPFSRPTGSFRRPRHRMSQYKSPRKRDHKTAVKLPRSANAAKLKRFLNGVHISRQADLVRLVYGLPALSFKFSL